MNYTFSEHFGSGWKSSHYVEFDIDLSTKEKETIITFLKENGDCDYAELEFIDGPLLAHLQTSVGAYPKIVHKRYIKKGRSDTPLS